MLRFFQSLGKSLMLPVACLPVGGVLMGLGYWIDPSGWGANSLAAMLLIQAGGILLDHMAVLFALGVAVGMSKQQGAAAMAAMLSWLTVQTMLGAQTAALLLGVPAESQLLVPFAEIDNQLLGILCGLLAAACCNRFYHVQLPNGLSFFAGCRLVPVMTVLITLLCCVPLYILWPMMYRGLVWLGQSIVGMGAVGAGLYGFLNRLLVPVGLHHILNSVFWFDVANINDIGKFWGIVGGGVPGQTGMYQAGFFPVMMLGLPGAALAMYHTAHPERKGVAGGILLSAALCCFVTGVTEPLEFAFMFLAPGLYLIHAVLVGLCVGIVAALPVRAGFQFSAGLIDWILSVPAPMAKNPVLLLPIGLVCFVLYYLIFRVLIVRLNLSTLGRESGHEQVLVPQTDYVAVARAMLVCLGGRDNISCVEHCITRLRLELKNGLLVNEAGLKAAGALGVVRAGRAAVQIVLGPRAQFVADALKNLVCECTQEDRKAVQSAADARRLNAPDKSAGDA